MGDVRGPLDFPIPLPSGAIAWLRVPWPMGDDDMPRLERGLRAGLRFARLAGWVTPADAEEFDSGIADRRDRNRSVRPRTTRSTQPGRAPQRDARGEPI